MASTTAFYTGLSGLSAHARKLDVIGDNIANVSTTAFKASRIQFKNHFPRTLTAGLAPNGDFGGTNPIQVGHGVTTAAIQRNFNVGSISPTGDGRDLAIDGDGFFPIQRDGLTFYTRDGSFRRNENNDLSSVNGDLLLGYGVDANFNVIEGQLQPINVPLGELRIAEATANVAVGGNLNADGDVASSGSTTQLRSNATQGFSLISSAGGTISATSRLVQIQDPSITAFDQPLFFAGQTLELTGAQKGGKDLPTESLAITAATTIQDFLTFVNRATGLFSIGDANPDGAEVGATLDPATGIISITGNTGAVNELTFDAADFRLRNEDGTLAGQPFTPVQTVPASGESSRTTIVVYDSLGTPATIDVTFSLVDKGLDGTTWRYDISSADNAGGNLFLQSGTVGFDTLGQLADTSPISISLGRAGTGAASPLTFDLALTGSNGRLTALTDVPSEFTSVFRDGFPTGTLETYAVDADGFVIGAFSNGATKTLGQVVLARFTNNDGLLDLGENLWNVGANSGPATIVTPGDIATGKIVAGSLELSNVDLGQEFIDLILTSTGYSASTRIIRTADELMQQLLVLGR